MALYFNGTLVGSGNFQFNGVTPDKVYFNGIEVWQNQSPPGSQTFTSSGTFTVPQGYSVVTICMVGGGGGGAQGTYHKHGGHAGAVVSQTVAVTTGQNITVTIGTGGNGPKSNDNNSRAGGAGTASSFGAISASGGGGGSSSNSANQPYYGHGAQRVTCGGTNVDGNRSQVGSWSASGGQSSGFGKGGNGTRYDYHWAENGGVGSGGGGARHYAGNGGRGEVRVSWS